MFRMKFLFLGCLISICVATTINIDLEYSLDDWNTVKPLGVIELSENYDGNYTGSFKPVAESNSLGADLFAHKEDLYRIRAKSGDQEILTYTKPCLLLHSRLVHLFWVAIDTDSQKLNSVTVFPDNLFGGDDSEECPSAPKNAELHAVVHVHNTAALPAPDTQSFIQKVEKERKARQHGAAEDNRSFLAKYWMYILPVVIFMAISGATNDQQEGAAPAE